MKIPTVRRSSGPTGLAALCLAALAFESDRTAVLESNGPTGTELRPSEAREGVPMEGMNMGGTPHISKDEQLYLVDGVVTPNPDIQAEDIEKIRILTGDRAKAKYGSDYSFVVEITLKKGGKNK